MAASEARPMTPLAPTAAGASLSGGPNRARACARSPPSSSEYPITECICRPSSAPVACVNRATAETRSVRAGHRLSQDRPEPVGGRAAGVAEVDLVVLAGHPQAVGGDE